MSLTNSPNGYGGVAKTFHWLTALLIFSALALGFIAHNAPFEDSAQLTAKARLFSLHKTIGLATFFTALLRICWAVTQQRPKLLNGENKTEAWAAETAHWVLYGAMVLVPLTGWIHHAATTGFAPIWWPFGQSLPFVPKDPTVAAVFGGAHYSFMCLMVVTLFAHVGGAMKHLVIDRDKTLQRIWPGKFTLTPPPAEQPGHLRPILSAFAAWALVLFLGNIGGQFDLPERQESQALAEVTSQWQVERGTLAIAVQQFGSQVHGEFANWTAEIDFEETATDGRHGLVHVTVATDSLTLGSVTDQALGADFLNVAAHPTATYSGDIYAAEAGYEVRGALTINGHELPITLPFALSIDGDTAQMTSALSLDRRDFHVGDTMADESSLGFGVSVTITLSATRGVTPDDLAEG